MPIYIYKTENKGCEICGRGFEILQEVNETKLRRCPECKGEIRRIYSGFSIQDSKNNLDQRAKKQGFHKLKKVDKGKYEKLY